MKPSPARPDLERLLRMTREGDSDAQRELARALGRSGEPWGVALALREPLYEGAMAALDALGRLTPMLEPAPVLPWLGCDPKLVAAAPGRADVLERVVTIAEELVQALPGAERPTERWFVELVLATARSAAAARRVLRSARLASSRSREAKLLGELGAHVELLADLTRALRGWLPGVVRRLDAALWADQVCFAPVLEPVWSQWWDEYRDYDDYRARTLLEASEAVLRRTGRLQICSADDTGWIAVELDARLLRKGWLRALVAANSGMGDVIRDGARTSWGNLLDWLRPEHALAVDALRRTLELWRSEEGILTA